MHIVQSRTSTTALLAAMSLVITLLVAVPAAATSFTVNAAGDTTDAAPGDGVCDDGGGDCTLRAAVMEANALEGPDTLELVDETYTLSITGSGGDHNGDLDVTESLRIVATGQDAAVEAGTGFSDRLFDVQTPGVDLTLEGFAAGNGTSSNGGALRFDAGSGTVQLVGMTFSGNQATTGDGGAVFVKTGTLVVETSTFSGNSAGDDGGAVSVGDLDETDGDSPATIASSTFQGNEASTDTGGNGGDGGAIHAVAALTVTDSVFDSNLNTSSLADNGGAIHSEAGLTVDGSTFTGNRARDFGGAINAAGSAGAGAELSISSTTFDGNVVSDGDGDGGAIYTSVPATISDSDLSNNSADDDGGALYANAVPVTVERSELVGNTATDVGGAIDLAASDLTIRRSTLSGNSSTNDDGGALNVDPSSSASLVNVTVSGNSAGDAGAGIASAGTLDTSFVTIVQNTAARGVGLYASGGTATLTHTLLADNGVENCRETGDSITSSDFNVADDTTCALVSPGDQEGVAGAGIEPLSDNGGPTSTHALVDASPAVDVTGSDCESIAGTPLDADQRGSSRPSDGDEDGTSTCDAGAFELQSTTAPSEEPTEEPTDEPTEEPTDEPTEDPTDEPTEEPTDEPTEEPEGVQRLAGSTRWETAIGISQERFADGAANVVVLARGDNGANDDGYADALAGTPLAVELGGPLLITAPDQLLTEVEAEIGRVLGSPGTVYLLGGEAALSGAIEQRLDELGYETPRLAGAGRIETALTIAQEVDASPDAILITRGWAFPDALAAGPAAAHVGGVVVSNGDGARSEAVEEYLAQHPDVPAYAIGGQIAGLFPELTPVFGMDRFETATAVAGRFFTDPVAVGLARSDTFPDSLSGGAHIGSRGGPMLLTPSAAVSTDLHPEAAAYVCTEQASLRTGYVYGGTIALSISTEEVLDERIRGTGC